jgi:adenine-specific DNA-methyltransferase
MMLMNEYQPKLLKTLGQGSLVHRLYAADNLLVLSYLLKHYKSKIQIQYIDPPYDTGHNFGYEDNRTSDWLYFMSKRLKLAYSLMSEDGILFISIDETAYAKLKIKADTIFNDCESFTFIWQNKHTITNDKENGLCCQTEFILCYSKPGFISRRLDLNPEYVADAYRYDDKDGRGAYRLVPTYKKKTVPSFTITSPSGKEWKLGWNFSEKKWKQLVKDKRIFWGKDGDAQPQKKVYLSTSKGTPHRNLLLGEDVGYTGDGTKDLNTILGKEMRSGFLYPKPVKLLEYLIRIHPCDTAIVLDWFAGTGTTFHAVGELNKRYGSKLRCFLATSNESSKGLPNGIALDICWERMKQVVDKIHPSTIELYEMDAMV